MPGKPIGSTWFSRFAPSDRVVVILLFVIAATFSVRLPAVPQARPAWLLHTGVFLAFAAAAAVMTRRPDAAWVAWLRAVATICVLMLLYSTLGPPVFKIIPWRADRVLAAADTSLFAGHSPAWFFAGAGTGKLEFWSFIYGFFVPFLYVSIFLNCVGRPQEEREEFLTGFAITYAIAYLGYLFLPSTGPIEYFPGAAPPSGGPIHRMILSSVAKTGGNHGAFPSLHVGAASYLCLFDWRYSLLRGMTYAPVVVLIAFSTLFLQYHYVVDLLTGLAIAMFANRAAAVWHRERARTA
jgi:hypothetical protein